MFFQLCLHLNNSLAKQTKKASAAFPLPGRWSTAGLLLVCGLAGSHNKRSGTLHNMPAKRQLALQQAGAGQQAGHRHSLFRPQSGDQIVRAGSGLRFDQ